MEYKKFVRKHFFNAVRESVNIDPSLKDALLRCENKISVNSQGDNITRFIENLAREIPIVQTMTVKRGDNPYHLGELKELIYSMTYVFTKGLENKAKAAYQSDLAKRLQDQELQNIKDMDATIDGKPSGVFEEMGVQFATDRERKI